MTFALKTSHPHLNALDVSFRAVCAVFILCAALWTSGCTSAYAEEEKKNLYENKYASIVMDSDTGMILQQRYADKKLYPASLTKIMTLFMAFEALQKGDISLKDRIVISKYAATMVPSKLDLPPGASIRVRDAIYILVTKSANDVAVAMAEHLGGTEHNFARQMTRRAKQLGMKNTRFTNASGLHDPRQISTARDMAKLARTIIVNYPTYYRYFSKAKFKYNGKTYKNHNKLLTSYSGMDGMKTGYIRASGFNLVASATRNNRRIIGVVFGGRTSKSRNDHMAMLLDKGFVKIGRVRVAHRSIPTPDSKPVYANGGYKALQNAPQTPFVAAKPTISSPSAKQATNNTYATRRLETGSLAIAAHKRRRGLNNAQTTPQNPAALSLKNAQQARLESLQNTAQDNAIAAYKPSSQTNPTTAPTRAWSIQIGAFSSRARSDQVVTAAREKMPAHLAHAVPMVAPLKAGEDWIFRARLHGFSKAEAYEACQYMEGCMAIAPKRN